MATTYPVRNLDSRWKPVLGAFLALTALSTVLLYLLSDRTADLFAWTINPPLTAAFLGGGYAAGFVLVLLIARDRSWEGARVGLVSVWVFTVLSLVATLFHLDKFHFETGPFTARFAAWVWLGVYIVVPVAMGALIAVELRRSRTRRAVRPPAVHPLPDAMGAALVAQGTVLGLAGAALMLGSTSATSWWAWDLTPLTAKAAGAWLIAIAVAAFLAVFDRDLSRLRAATTTYAVYALLQVAALVRFETQVHWDRPATWAYVVVLLATGLTGAVGIVASRRLAGAGPTVTSS